MEELLLLDVRVGEGERYNREGHKEKVVDVAAVMARR